MGCFSKILVSLIENRSLLNGSLVEKNVLADWSIHFVHFKLYFSASNCISLLQMRAHFLLSWQNIYSSCDKLC